MVTINKGLCIGCGACAATCPEGFEMAGDGKSQPKAGGEKAACIKAAAEACPVGAISV
ncbi:ferredoxin [archaeon]